MADSRCLVAGWSQGGEVAIFRHAGKEGKQGRDIVHVRMVSESGQVADATFLVVELMKALSGFVSNPEKMTLGDYLKQMD